MPLAIIAGIDEAGFGPVLGPLVVSATVFSLPDELMDLSMWQLLAGAVSRKVSKRRATIAIADSKELYNGLRGSKGLAELEKGVLVMLAASGQAPGSLVELLSAVAADAVPRARGCTWYDLERIALPTVAKATSITLQANALRARMAAAGVSFHAAHSQLVFAGELNRLVGLSNKSQLLFDVTARLLARLWRELPPGQTARIYVDRQGGRTYYLPNLQRVFENCRFKVLEETDALSAYRLSDTEKEAEIHFVVGCENRHLPAALASMMSKYLRELFMTMFNAYWADKVPNLAPTAGYYQDGRRFYGQILPAMRAMGIGEESVYRSR